MLLNKLKLLICICIVLSTNFTYSQNWGNSDIIDTTFSKKGSIEKIYNLSNQETIYFDYYKNGKILRMTLVSKKNNIQYEQTKEYSIDGILERKYFANVIDHTFFGKVSLDSIWTEYYTNGAIKLEMEYQNNKLYNLKYFDTEGNLVNTGDFKNGNGELITYEEGIVVRKCKYKNGKIIIRSCHCDRISQIDKISHSTVFRSRL